MYHLQSSYSRVRDHDAERLLVTHLFHQSLGLIVNRPHETVNAGGIHVKADVA